MDALANKILDYINEDYSINLTNDLLNKIRWPNGMVCPFCNNNIKIWVLSSNQYKCNNCLKKFSTISETIFENTKVDLNKWLRIIIEIKLCDEKVNSCWIAKDLNITQKSAWNMIKKIIGTN